MNTSAIKSESSRDLSEQFGGCRLDVEITGVGKSHTNFNVLVPLSDHVRTALFLLTGTETQVDDPRKSPWCIVSYDRDTRKLVVKPVPVDDF